MVTQSGDAIELKGAGLVVVAILRQGGEVEQIVQSTSHILGSEAIGLEYTAIEMEAHSMLGGKPVANIQFAQAVGGDTTGTHGTYAQAGIDKQMVEECLVLIRFAYAGTLQHMVECASGHLTCGRQGDGTQREPQHVDSLYLVHSGVIARLVGSSYLTAGRSHRHRHGLSSPARDPSPVPSSVPYTHQRGHRDGSGRWRVDSGSVLRPRATPRRVWHS